MEVSLLNKGSLKIKGKNAVLVVDPATDSPKTEADAAVFLDSSRKQMPAKVQNVRVLIGGPGEYEVGGIKISGISFGGKVVYSLEVDGIKLALGSLDVMGKVRDKISECQMAVLNISDGFDQSVFSSLDPSVAILYGETVEENIKKFGLEIKGRVSKYSTTSEKIPQELETLVLE